MKTEQTLKGPTDRTHILERLNGFYKLVRNKSFA
jgi:hypothetical protein